MTFTTKDIGKTLVQYTIDPEIAWLENVANNAIKVTEYAKSLGFVTDPEIFDELADGSDEEYTYPIHESNYAIEFLKSLCDESVTIVEVLVDGVKVERVV